MSHVGITFTVTEFCLHTGLTRAELTEIIGLGVLEPQGKLLSSGSSMMDRWHFVSVLSVCAVNWNLTGRGLRWRLPYWMR